MSAIIASMYWTLVFGSLALVVMQIRWHRQRRRNLATQIAEWERQLDEQIRMHGPITAVEPAPSLTPDPEPVKPMTRRERRRVEKDLRALLDELDT